ncbi:MAG: exodeoxyribonuclease III [Spirochaetaceae bacterium]|nr:exodeoxyribonuclease III [Spirochaetaceae bacterium]|tara:strand:+ start:41278 stop:42405 length:1128 start_codon:yes stop_codon:yes gene_type:complete
MATSRSSKKASPKKSGTEKSPASRQSPKQAVKKAALGATTKPAKESTKKSAKKSATGNPTGKKSSGAAGGSVSKKSGSAKSAATGAASVSQDKERAAAQDRLQIHIPKKDSIKIYSWNVNGIRANIKKGFFDWVESEAPDIFCLQETRATIDQLQDEKKSRPILNLDPYESHWHVAEKKGYSGVATFSSLPVQKAYSGFPQDDPRRNFNEEGRVVITELDEFVLWNVYFPNGGRGPERVKYKLEFYDHCLNIWEETRKRGRPLIICGDYNTAHKEIDLARPKENQTTSGFLPEEREFLDRIVSMGYVDVFREFNQEPGQYTYWDQITRARDRNVGWRIDYFFVTEETMPLVKNAFNRMDVMGSDHCPVGLELHRK